MVNMKSKQVSVCSGFRTVCLLYSEHGIVLTSTKNLKPVFAEFWPCQQEGRWIRSIFIKGRSVSLLWEILDPVLTFGCISIHRKCVNLRISLFRWFRWLPIAGHAYDQKACIYIVLMITFSWCEGHDTEVGCRKAGFWREEWRGIEHPAICVASACVPVRDWFCGSRWLTVSFWILLGFFLIYELVLGFIVIQKSFQH